MMDTLAIHAPWWSDVQDADGRFVERVVVRDLTDKEIRSARKRFMYWMQSHSIGEVQSAMRNAGASELLLRMVEMTNEAGEPLPLNLETWLALPQRDQQYIRDVVDAWDEERRATSDGAGE